MLIKKMIIENFRQYKGIQEIVFSTDKEKNVTLFLGDNGAGKTVISQAFMWCFYGNTPAFLKKESLLSKIVEDEMYEGKSYRVSVKIFMTHKGCEYEIERVKRFAMGNEKLVGKEPSFTVRKIDDGGETKFLSGKELENCINEILPEELSEYFILSGEKIDSMSNDIKGGRSKDFAKAVNSILELDYYKSTIKHLKNISKEFDTSSVAGMEGELDEINQKIENSNINHDTLIKNKESFEKNGELLNEVIIKCKAQLQSTKSSSEIQRNIEEQEKRIERANNNIEITYGQGIKEFVEKMPKSFMENTVQKVNKTLDEIANLKTEEIPERLHADLIDWILKRGKCICGNSIQKGDECFEELEKWRKIVPPESFGVLAKTFASKMNDKILHESDLKDSFKKYKEQIIQRNSDIDEYEEELNRKKEELADIQDTSDIQKELYQAKDDFNENQKNLNETNFLIANVNSNLAQLRTEREKLISSNKEGKKLIAWKNMTEKLCETFQRQLKVDENAKREELIKQVKQSFQEIYGNSFSINIDENYKITTSNDLEKSTGQGMAVIFSFLAGLLKVIKNPKQEESQNSEEADFFDENSDFERNIPESYPLILDAPFSALDKQRIISICEVLPKVSDQIIIFIKDTDGDLAKQEMAGKIGGCYRLTKVGNSDMETKIEREEA